MRKSRWQNFSSRRSPPGKSQIPIVALKSVHELPRSQCSISGSNVKLVFWEAGPWGRGGASALPPTTAHDGPSAGPQPGICGGAPRGMVDAPGPWSCAAIMRGSEAFEHEDQLRPRTHGSGLPDLSRLRLDPRHSVAGVDDGVRPLSQLLVIHALVGGCNQRHVE